MKRVSSIILSVLAVALLASCGGDTTTSTVTDTKTTTVKAKTKTVTETTGTTTTPASSGETADLPPCSEGALPCVNPDGSVTETPEGGGADGSGEVADLPLCSDSPPPCRNPDGSFVEP
jgi:hypothetical protein